MPDSPLASPADVLSRVFGFSAFRGLQQGAIDRVMAGGDALVVMPTGGGKSLCYQIPALCRPGMGVVVSPLIALMEDQVAALRQAGVAAAALHSELDDAERRAVQRDLHDGALDLLYVSPERLLGNGLMDRLAGLRIALFAVDEAHCVSAWGHEFRPEYRGLSVLGTHFPGVPRIALTATADPRTCDDIVSGLAMPDAARFVASFHRPNLHLAAEAKVGESAQLLAFLAGRAGQCGIVYCRSRAKTEAVAQRLVSRGFDAIAFHAGLDPALKRARLTRFRSGDPVIMVATIAFGMGIDRPDVRFVVHMDLPDSPQAYYQEIGRAGRDGLRADTKLLYGGEDFSRARHWVAQGAGPESQRRVARMHLDQMIGLAETGACRTRALLAAFGEELGTDCGHCDTCASPPAMADGTEDAQKVLSAVLRTRQMFGAVHVVAVLRGERTDAVLRHGHEALPTFGVGAERTPTHWRGVIRQLIAAGVLDVDTDGHGALVAIAEQARPILRGEVRFTLRAEAAPAPRARLAAKQAAPANPDDPCFARLRAWRKDVATAQKLPPYVIFHDATLLDICAARPATLAELGQVKGVGASKLERYGSAVLEALAQAA